MAWITDGYKNGTDDISGDLNAFANATKVIGNTPLEFVSGSSFQSSTMMFVGTYLSYYPFNEDLKSVGELKLSVGANQTSKDMADAYNKMIFASDTLSLKAANAGTGKTPVINMKRLSNMLILDIYLKAASTTMTDPVIQKVELDLQDGSTGSLLATSGTVVPKNWTTAKTQESDKKYFKSLTGTGDYMTPDDKGMITVTTTEDIAVSKTQPATVYMSFMPSDLSSLDASNCVLNVYTNYGVIKYSVSDAMKIYDWDGTAGAYKTTAAGDIQAAFGGADKSAGRLIKKKVEIDLSKVSVDNLTATNATEIRNIVNNWKLLGSSATPITIKVEHPAAYQEKFAENEGSGKTAKNIELEALDLSDIPANLTLETVDTLVFKGTTNLNASKTITVQKESADASVIFNGNTTIGTLGVNGLIEFNENTTIKGTLTQVPDANTSTIKVANEKTLTVDAGNLVSNTENNSKLINAGTISLINSGAINKGETNNYLAIENYSVKATTPSTTYYEGTINIGDNESQGYLAGTTESLFNNGNGGKLRFYNGAFVAPGEGTVIAVASNAMQFSAAVASNVTTIEVTGEIKFSAFDLDATAGKKTTVVMKSGSKLNMGTKTVTLGSVVVAENATIEGSKLIVFKGDADGKLSINPSATLTVGDNTEINANVLDLPTSSKIEGDAETSKVIYKTAGPVGGTYTANVTQKADLSGVE